MSTEGLETSIEELEKNLKLLREMLAKMRQQSEIEDQRRRDKELESRYYRGSEYAPHLNHYTRASLVGQWDE